MRTRCQHRSAQRSTTHCACCAPPRPAPPTSAATACTSGRLLLSVLTAMGALRDARPVHGAAKSAVRSIEPTVASNLVFTPTDVRYDADARTGICPTGKLLRRRSRRHVTDDFVGEHFQSAPPDGVPSRRPRPYRARATAGSGAMAEGGNPSCCATRARAGVLRSRSNHQSRSGT